MMNTVIRFAAMIVTHSHTRADLVNDSHVLVPKDDTSLRCGTSLVHMKITTPQV